MESLCIQRDILYLQNRLLEVENAYLRDCRPGASARALVKQCVREMEDIRVEIRELRQLLRDSQEREANSAGELPIAREQFGVRKQQTERQTTDVTADDVERLAARGAALRSCCDCLEREVEKERGCAELEWYRAFGSEHLKWAARKRLLVRLRELQAESATSVVQPQGLQYDVNTGREPERGNSPSQRENPGLSGQSGEPRADPVVSQFDGPLRRVVNIVVNTEHQTEEKQVLQSDEQASLCNLGRHVPCRDEIAAKKGHSEADWQQKSEPACQQNALPSGKSVKILECARGQGPDKVCADGSEAIQAVEETPATEELTTQSAAKGRDVSLMEQNKKLKFRRIVFDPGKGLARTLALRAEKCNTWT